MPVSVTVKRTAELFLCSVSGRTSKDSFPSGSRMAFRERRSPLTPPRYAGSFMVHSAFINGTIYFRVPFAAISATEQIIIAMPAKMRSVKGSAKIMTLRNTAVAGSSAPRIAVGVLPIY